MLQTSAGLFIQTKATKNAVFNNRNLSGRVSPAPTPRKYVKLEITFFFGGFSLCTPLMNLQTIGV